MPKPSLPIDNDRFRAVLGSYPTGVAVVTGLDVEGSPLGMVVGTFTSVSLDPPLVAFLPMKTSRTFKSLRETSTTFCINILAADQEHVCRTLAAPIERKFDSVPWHTSPAGNPVIDGVVAWIDCNYENVIEGGDHYIVLGRVTAMDLERDTAPLLYFQRGYGRFSTGPLVIANERETLQYVRLAETAREEIERVAAELLAECSVVAPVGGDSIYVAIADHSPQQRGRSRLGVRAPMTPPLGALFVGNPNAPTDEAWLSRLGKVDAAMIAQAREQLARVRGRGWSISLLGEISSDDLDQAVELYSSPQRTPEQERRFLSTVAVMCDLHEPAQIYDTEHYDVLHLSVPVKRPNGEVLLALRLGALPRAIPGSRIHEALKRLAVAAARVETLIARLPEYGAT